MSEPIGATHDLEVMIWHKPLPDFIPGMFYDLVFCDGSSGQVKHKRWRVPAHECSGYIKSLLEYHAFAYVSDSFV